MLTFIWGPLGVFFSWFSLFPFTSLTFIQLF